MCSLCIFKANYSILGNHLSVHFRGRFNLLLSAVLNCLLFFISVWRNLGRFLYPHWHANQKVTVQVLWGVDECGLLVISRLNDHMADFPAPLSSTVLLLPLPRCFLSLGSRSCAGDRPAGHIVIYSLHFD